MGNSNEKKASRLREAGMIFSLEQMAEKRNSDIIKIDEMTEQAEVSADDMPRILVAKATAAPSGRPQSRKRIPLYTVSASIRCVEVGARLSTFFLQNFSSLFPSPTLLNSRRRDRECSLSLRPATK